jgi:hypothetical protein
MKSFRCLVCIMACVVVSAYAQDLHIKKNVSVGGYIVSTSESSIKGARERTVSQGPNGNTITLRQCDLRRTLSLNEQAQTYFVNPDPQDENAARAAALATGVPAGQAAGGKITITTTLTDTGERKTLFGYQARHLKGKIEQQSSDDACTKVHQTFTIDGWFADVSKAQASCSALGPAVQEGTGCHDVVISRHVGSGRIGYPIEENITMPNPDGTSTTVSTRIAELAKQQLPDEMFDVPAGYRQVNSMAELNGVPAPAQSAQAGAGAPPASYGQSPAGPNPSDFSPAKMMNPMNQLAMQKQMMAQASQMGMGPGGMPNMGGMTGMSGNQPSSTQVAAPQALGPKAPGKIRIGVAPPEAQVGQGNNAGADYSTPIRNAEVALMSGPAVEIAALDSHIAMQLQAEAQQKQCDYILYSSVAVKHSSGGGFGRFMKMAAPVASMTPIGAMGRGMGGAVAAQAAGAAASAAAMSAQQQAMNQLSGFNGQIKSKDDVTVQYQLVATGQTSPRLQNSLQGKAKSDGEDVLTPLLQQAATSVLTEVTKK